MESGAPIELIHEGRRIAAADLERRVQCLVQDLRQAGLKPGALCAAFADDVLKIVLLRQALRELGAGLVPLAPPSGSLPDELRRWGVGWFWDGRQAQKLARSAGGGQMPSAFLVRTSGSTGEPKGVLLTESAVEAAALRVNQRLDLRPDDLWLLCLPLQHMGGLAILERCRQAGSALWLQQGFDVVAVAEALATGWITHLSLVPAMLWRLLEAGVRPPSSLRVALIGGQALSPPLAEQAHAAGWPLHVSYGASETGGMIACESGPGAGLAAGRVGGLLPDVSVRTESDGGLSVAGPVLMSGYANPEGRPGEGLVDGWFTTGDLGALDGQGILWIRGRRDEVLVSGGENIHPSEVEAALAGVADLGEVALSGVPDPVWGTRLVLFYTGPASPETAEAICRERLSGARRPRRLVRVKSLPLRGAGKLDRRRLALMAARHLELE
ncbi:MAG: hypothetical protein D6720_03725 [Gammaproteobacteria bacterium]|nr:MAG: hypothetical protein D6720_03725 [Gammaproteobacteria bacterium]